MVIVRATELNNKNIYVLQIEAKLVLQIWAALLLLQIRANVVTKSGSYNKLWQSVLQIGAGITN